MAKIVKSIWGVVPFWALFLFLVQPVYAGITVVLDLDDTVLKEVSTSYKNQPLTQQLHYKPSDAVYEKYRQRLEAKKKGEKVTIHYDLYSDKSMRGYVVVRPGIEKLLQELKKDPTNKIYIASNNDPARTDAVVQQLKIGGKTLQEWEITAIPKPQFNLKKDTKDFSSIRNYLGLAPADEVVAIDDRQVYVNPSKNDRLVLIEPWDWKHGIHDYYKNPQPIIEKNLQEVNQVLGQVLKKSVPPNVAASAAGVNLVLDLDDTVLKEAPAVAAPGNSRIQSMRYKPSEGFYKRYAERLKNPEPGKIIHYTLHPETQEITGYVTVRPGMEQFLEEFKKNPNNKIYIANNSDPKRTQALFKNLKIGKYTLEELGATLIPEEKFIKENKKDLGAIRTDLKLPPEAKLMVVDNDPKAYMNVAPSDQVLQITPWDYNHGIDDYINQKSQSVGAITAKNTLELNQLLAKISPQAPLLSAPAPALVPPPAALAPLSPQHFKIPPPPKPDFSKSHPHSPNDEYYSERPDIATVKPEDHSNILPSTWRQERAGHLEAVVQLLEMYPDRHLYFLARDGEYLYDFLKTALANEPQQLERIHLINVSRANMHDPNLVPYLAQEGISKENLEKGMKVLFVDTGFAGTIPRTISEKFPEYLRKQLQTHLMCSETPLHPSSRVFLEHFSPGMSSKKPALLHASIISYEHMVRYLSRARFFKEHNGRWEPTGVKGKDADGQVSQSAALRYMQDLKNYALSENGKALWEKRRVFWRRMRNLLDQGKKDEIEKELKTLLQSKDELLNKAIVRDYLELVARNEPTLAKLLPSLKALGLKEVGVAGAGASIAGSAGSIASSNPQLKPILENPEDQIPALVNGNDEQIKTLRNIIDLINDQEVKPIIARALFFSTDQAHLNKTLETLDVILKNKPEWVDVLKKQFNKKAHIHGRIIEEILKSQNPAHLALKIEAAKSLAYYQGEDLAALSEKALTDSNPAVREEAGYALKYRNSNDPQLFSKLMTLLQNPSPQVRKEVSDLIKSLYPAFHGNAAFNPGFKSYLNSDCTKSAPQDILDPHHLQSLLSFLPVSATGHPITLVPPTDPRLAGLHGLVKSGPIFQAAGKIWTSFPGLMTFHQASKSCESLGKGWRLPIKKELGELGRALGKEVPGQVYNVEQFPLLKGKRFLAGDAFDFSIASSAPSVQIFAVDSGEFYAGFPSAAFNTVCVK